MVDGGKKLKSRVTGKKLTRGKKNGGKLHKKNVEKGLKNASFKMNLKRMIK